MGNSGLPAYILFLYGALAASITAFITVTVLLIRSCQMNKRYLIKETHLSQKAAKLERALLASENAAKAKSMFLANMSHEIRTPMNSIIVFSDLALEGNVSETTKDYLRKIKISSETLLQIVNNILDSSKIESGKVELENIPFDINEIFRVCQIITAPMAEKKGLTLVCNAQAIEGKMVVGDPARLTQALLNLLSNAVKFTESGTVNLISVVKQIKNDTAEIYFEVTDDGIGLTKEQAKKIFEPYTQADKSTTRKFGGTGLGLAITKNIIEMMGGELLVESAIGIGSKFSFSITLATVNAAIHAQPKHNIPKDNSSTTGTLNTDDSLALISKLEPLIDSGNLSCLDYIEKIQMLPNSGELVAQIQSYDFIPAYGTLQCIKQSIKAVCK